LGFVKGFAQVFRLTFNARRYILVLAMIKSFKCPVTQSLFAGQPAPRFVNIRRVAERKLEMLHRALTLDDLRAPPNNRLEALQGRRKGQHSIRVNDQWRVCFVWREGHAWQVEIVDYH
jgi:proteic killer suppression protein